MNGNELFRGASLKRWLDGLLPVANRCVEVTLRLPGFILLELWFRSRVKDYRDAVPDAWKPQLIQNQQIVSFLQFERLEALVKSGALDEAAAIVLSYSGIRFVDSVCCVEIILMSILS